MLARVFSRAFYEEAYRETVDNGEYHLGQMSFLPLQERKKERDETVGGEGRTKTAPFDGSDGKGSKKAGPTTTFISVTSQRRGNGDVNGDDLSVAPRSRTVVHCFCNTRRGVICRIVSLAPDNR